MATETTEKLSNGVENVSLNGDKAGATPGSGVPPMSKEQLVMMNQGLLPGAANLIQAVDPNWLAAMTRVDLDFASIPPETDYVAMRKWVSTEFVKYDHEPKCARLRPEVEVKVEDVKVEYDESERFRIRVYDPQGEEEEGKPRPLVIMYHGGGWIHGAPEVDEAFATFLASDLRSVIFNVDYRLAPEHTIQTLHNDCYSALTYALSHTSSYNINPSHIALWGCSAGAHLAASVAMRDAQETHPSPSRISQVNLVVPVTCHIDALPGVLAETTQHKRALLAPLLAASGSPVTVEAMEAAFRGIFSLVAPPPIQPDHPLVSPLRHPRPWPPGHARTLVTVAGCDQLADQGVAYYMALRDEGVDAALEVIPGVPHGFTWAVEANATKAWVRNQVRVLERAFREEV